MLWLCTFQARSTAQGNETELIDYQNHTSIRLQATRLGNWTHTHTHTREGGDMYMHERMETLGKSNWGKKSAFYTRDGHVIVIFYIFTVTMTTLSDCITPSRLTQWVCKPTFLIDSHCISFFTLFLQAQESKEERTLTLRMTDVSSSMVTKAMVTTVTSAAKSVLIALFLTRGTAGQASSTIRAPESSNNV